MTGVGKYSCPHCGKNHMRFQDVCPEKELVVPETYRLEGEVIDGKFEITERIGEGGMGVVYKGYHLNTGRDIAVKFLHTEIRTSKETVERFREEARTAASVGHDNIVEILDMGRYQDKFHYIVMEFVDGEGLDRTLEAEGRLPSADAVDTGIQILKGLRAAHEKGIIHRDLKPENIFVVEDPERGKYVKIVDFGIALIAQEQRQKQRRLTKDGALVGTPTYMSPEQARGSPDIDHRADIYSVGVILYEMLTGVPPFDSDNVSDLLVRIVSEEPTPPLGMVPLIPHDLSDLVMKALAREPGERYASAEAFIAAIAPFSTGGGTMKEAPRAERDSDGFKQKREIKTLHGEVVESAAVSGKADVSAGTGGRRKRGVRFAIVLLILLVVTAGIAAMVIINKGSGEGGEGVRVGGGGEKKAPPVWELSFVNLPEGATIIIDNEVRTGISFSVQDSSEKHGVRVEWKKRVIFDKDILIRKNVEIIVGPLEPHGAASAPPVDPEPETLEKGSKVKKKKKGKGEGTIDKHYPKY